MPNNWKTYKLSEITDVITKGTTPSTYGFGFTDDGVNFIKSESTSYDGRLDENAFVKISEEAHQKLKRSQLKENDILFSMAGAYLGKTGIIYKNHLPANTNQANGIIRVNENKALPKFICFLLRNPSLISYVNASAGQSAQPNINLTDIGNLEFNLPLLEEQQSIASILSAIDDKIENNLAINKTLEEMAMALYKHWFVDFGPFKDGEFVESELGLIPKGWEVKKITTLIDVKDGTHDSPKRVEDGHFLITSKHMSGNSIDFSSAYKVSFEDFSKINKRSLVEKGDILMTMIGTVGNFYFVNEEPNYVIKNIGLFKTSKTPELQSYFYSYFKSKIGQEFIKAQMTGSTQQYVTLNTLRNFDIIIPNKQTLTSFNQITNDYFERIMINTKENQTLTLLRDTLLPKLISGEVRLKEFREN
ncbi:restriction endonuclease subunit S [Flavobacterium cheonanense]|uniref:Restriction endonuclease subunit S n=1 Tax=Flavobacterium cheonanense TaxID=706183 RepID=A0ABP7VV89_9FLAO